MMTTAYHPEVDEPICGLRPSVPKFEVKSSPTPWKTGKPFRNMPEHKGWVFHIYCNETGYLVAHVYANAIGKDEGKQRAAFIVDAANSYDDRREDEAQVERSRAIMVLNALRAADLGDLLRASNEYAIPVIERALNPKRCDALKGGQ
jgi:hypothetical protein